MNLTVAGLTGSFVFESVSPLSQSLLQSVSVLLSALQLRLLLVTPQLQASALARGGLEKGKRH